MPNYQWPSGLPCAWRLRSLLIAVAATVAVQAGTGPALAAGPDLSGMSKIFDDEFDGSELDLRRWKTGSNLANQQWGSDSYFVSPQSPPLLFSKVYSVTGGVLTLRANYDATFRDPSKWGRHWYSGMIIPLGAEGTPQSAAFRLGCYEIREKFPAGKGVWPGNWAVNVAAQTHGDNTGGTVEIDGLEAYGFDPTLFISTAHLWGPGRDEPTQVKVQGPDLTKDFHTFAFCADATDLKVWVDGALRATLPLPRAATLDKLFWMTNLAIGGGWPVEVPPSGAYDMQVNYVRIWSKDPDAVSTR